MEITVERIPATEFTPELARVVVALPSGSADVMAYGPGLRFGAVQDAQVNWSAIGSVSPADALSYAAAIALAASIAPTLGLALSQVSA